MRLNLEKQIAGETTIEKLPENILLDILRYLSMKDRCRSRRVCKNWSRVLSDNSLWRHVDLLEYRLELRTMWKIVRTHFSPCLLTMKIRGHVLAGDHKSWRAPLSDAMLKNLAARCPNLQLLHLHDCGTSNISFASLPPSITCLKIVSSFWQPRWMKDKQKHLAKLEHLTLKSVQVDAYDLEDIAFWKSLKCLSLMGCYRLGTSGVKTIADHLTELELLNLSGTHIDDLAVHHIAACLTKLKELSLAKCPSVSNGALATIAEGLPVLNKLDISYCPRITMIGLESLFISKLSVLIVERLKRLSETEIQTLKSGFPEDFILIA
ncbi:unnamed protein product [Candidula unifasciata]|uniref:F-box domain-containing protein n=1 Tax=Candidula unifasciata TaxID=100452 RepID=A0A8S3YP63_9EUPU|nr:unnamed protein product [Candidula unifasciata]